MHVDSVVEHFTTLTSKGLQHQQKCVCVRACVYTCVFVCVWICINKSSKVCLSVCRNPDGDNSPWCYTLSDSAISWEYCNIPSCQMPLSEFVLQSDEADRKILTYFIMWFVLVFFLKNLNHLRIRYRKLSCAPAWRRHSLQIYSLLFLLICNLTSAYVDCWSSPVQSCQKSSMIIKLPHLKLMNGIKHPPDAAL